MDFSWELLFRILLAAILGALIGYERQFKHKSAGLRTNILVCVGSCLIMILSNLIYENVEGKTNADPARLAAQVVSGIGFLGAGAIIKEGVNVIGLTTAACIWVVAGVGLAIGGGYYQIGIFSAILVYIVLEILCYIERTRWIMPADNVAIKIIIAKQSDSIKKIYRQLSKIGMGFKDTSLIFKDDDTIELNILLYNPKKLKRSEITTSLTLIEGIKSIDME